MSKSQYRILGFFMMLVSVFFLMGGLYLGNTGLPSFVPPLCLVLGLGLLGLGLFFYHVVKSEED